MGMKQTEIVIEDWTSPDGSENHVTFKDRQTGRTHKQISKDGALVSDVDEDGNDLMPKADEPVADPEPDPVYTEGGPPDPPEGETTEPKAE
jgi:hypothetical protein